MSEAGDIKYGSFAQEEPTRPRSSDANKRPKLARRTPGDTDNDSLTAGGMASDKALTAEETAVHKVIEEWAEALQRKDAEG